MADLSTIKFQRTGTKGKCPNYGRFGFFVLSMLLVTSIRVNGLSTIRSLQRRAHLPRSTINLHFTSTKASPRGRIPSRLTRDRSSLFSSSSSSGRERNDSNESGNDREDSNDTALNSESSLGKSITQSSSSESHINGAEDANGSSNLPSFRQLIVFTATTILIWISEPLLSLVDTTIVGMTASTSAKVAASRSAVVQIAALGPATTLYDSAVYMTYFLAIATTNLISPALAKRKWKELRESTSHLMGLALLFGLGVSLFTFGFGEGLITSMVGTRPTDLAMIPLATNYAKIRAAVAPFCVVDFCAQSFCLATLDTKTPAIAVAVASLVNIVGDLILSPRFGIQGAAVATAIATVSSCLILLRKVRQQTQEWEVFQHKEAEGEIDYYQHSSAIQPPRTQVIDGRIELIGPPVDTSPGSTSSGDKKESEDGIESPATVKSGEVPGMDSITGRQQRAQQNVPFFSLPNKKALVSLMNLAGPIFFVMMGKIACYSVMTVKATKLGIFPLAAHNIMMRIFFFFSCHGDSLSQAAQTFFPQVSENPIHRKLLFRRLLLLSAGVGLVISQASAFILSQLGGYLTKEAPIVKLMADYAPYVGSAIFLHPFLMLLEGSILASRDLVFLVAMYAATMPMHFGLVYSPLADTFGGLWKVFCIFQAIRLAQLGGRVFQQSLFARLRQRRAPTEQPIAA